MPNFDYISTPDFRSSLESDYEDMRRCAEVCAWKSAQVLAGSIVESLLIDYLVSTEHSERPKKDPLRMDLAEIIAICKAEKALSDRSADLCSVVRSYRNLIHPGRMVRLSEQPPNKTSCEISIALIDLIADEIAKTRRAAVGLTAEQVVSKLLRDPGCLTILQHLMQEVSEEQKRRLLIRAIPEAHRGELLRDPDFNQTAERLSQAYRIILGTATIETRKLIAAEFVRILKEEDGQRVDEYRRAFFRAQDINFAPETARPMVKEHLLGSVGSLHTLQSLRIIEEIGFFLEPDDCIKWTDPFVRTLASTTVRGVLKTKCTEAFAEATTCTSKEFDESLKSRLNDWLVHYTKQENEQGISVLRQMIDEVAILSPP